MKSIRRAIRRHHRQRMLRRALRSIVLSGTDDPEWRLCRARRWYNNLALCSCWMCGNPRRWRWAAPYQEQKLHQAARDDQDHRYPRAEDDLE